MKHFLNICLLLLLCACTSETSKEEDTNQKIGNIILNFSQPKKYVYSLESYVTSKNQDINLTGILTIAVKEKNLADVTFEYKEITSKTANSEKVALEPQTIILKDMNTSIQFQNGLEYLEMYPKLLFPVLSLTNGNTSPEIRFKVPVNLRDTRDSNPNSQTSIEGILLLDIEDSNLELKDDLVKFEGQIKANETVDKAGIEYIVDMKGNSNYIYNCRGHYFEEMLIKFNTSLESSITGASLVNVIQYYKFLRQE